MSIDNKMSEDYVIDKKKALVQCAILGYLIGFGAKMLFNNESPHGNVIIPGLMTANNFQLEARGYAKNIIVYNICSFVGFATYNALEILVM